MLRANSYQDARQTEPRQQNCAYEKQDFDKALYCYDRMEAITAIVKRGFVPEQEFAAAVAAREDAKRRAGAQT